MTEHDFQRKLIEIMNSKLIGIKIIAPPIDPITPSELGGTLYQFNLYTVNRKCSKKLEIHTRKNKQLYLGLHDSVNGNLEWWRDFSGIEEFAENFSKELKEFLPN